jgi:hypothetical protein
MHSADLTIEFLHNIAQCTMYLYQQIKFNKSVKRISNEVFYYYFIVGHNNIECVI